MTRADRELWDAGEIAGGLVPAGSVFAFLAEHRCEVFDDEFIADLFPSGTGRPSLPADLVGSVLVLKELFDLSDRQTADALMFDIRWKVACGRSLTQMSFDPSTLVCWRKRIARSERPDRVFDKVAEIIAETGILRGRRKRCVDSTVFDDAVAAQDTVTQLVAAMRKVARVAPGAAEVIAAVCKLDYSKPGKPDIDWDDPAAKQALVSELVNDALAVLEELTGPGTPERDQAAADAIGLLALVAGQDVEPAEGSDGADGRWVIARRVAPDRVVSVVDPQARHARKSRSDRRDGYRGHMAAEPDTGLITDCEMTMATGEENTDACVGVKMANRDRFHRTSGDADDAGSRGEDAEAADAAGHGVGAGGHNADADARAADAGTSAYAKTDTAAADADGAGIADADAVSGDADNTPASAEATSAAAADKAADAAPADDAADMQAPDAAGGRGGLEIYGDSAYGAGQARADYRDAGHGTVIKPKPLFPAIPGGFTLDDFDIDEDNQQVTCPAGHTRPMSPTRSVTFGRLCDDCPLRQRCTTAKTGRSMTIHEHEDLLRAARAQAKTPQFKQDYPTRSNIERTIAQAATQNGRRVKLRYIGVAKNNAWLHDRSAALNLRTLIKNGLTRLDGAWVIA
jgi:hypothetical protein